MTFYGDFTLAKDEAFGDRHVDISQKSSCHIRAAVRTYEKNQGLHLCETIQKENERRNHLLAKNLFHTGRIWKVTGCGEDKSTAADCQKGYEKPKTSRKTVVVEKDDDDPVEANKENIDPSRKYGGSNVWAFTWLLWTIPQKFRFFLSREKPELGDDFRTDMVLAFGLHSPAHDGFCYPLTDNHYHVLAQCFGEIHRGRPKSYLLPRPCTTYALLISNSHEKEVFGEMFEMLDQALHYDGDLQSLANKNPREYLPSICFFFVRKCDKAVQVSCGLSQTTMQRLETVMMGPYGGHLLIIADIFQTGHGSVNFPPVLTFSLNENETKWKIKKSILLNVLPSEVNQFQLCRGY